MTITFNVHENLGGWGTSATYSVGTTINNFGEAYRCVTPGTSASSGVGPTGTSSPITDGTVVWKWLSHIDYASLFLMFNYFATQPPTEPVIAQVWNNNGTVNINTAPFINFAATGAYPITVTPAPGEGFRDALSADSSKPLAFNAANGFSITITDTNARNNTVAYIKWTNCAVIWDGIQFKGQTSDSQADLIYGVTGGLRNCIIDGRGSETARSNGLVYLDQGTMYNCLLVDRSTTAGLTQRAVLRTYSSNKIVNCTFANVAGVGGQAVIDYSPSSGQVNLYENCIFTGYASAYVFSWAGAVVPNTSHCLFSNAASGMNANELGGSVYSKPSVNQFVNNTSNWRLLATADAIDIGVTDITANPNSDDIIKQTRTAGAWDLGAYEYLPPLIPTGTINAVTKKPVTAITGSSVMRMTISAATRKPSSSMSGVATLPTTGTVTSTTRKPSSSMSGIFYIPVTGSLTAITKKPVSSLSGVVTLPTTGTITAKTRKPVTAIMAVNPVATISARTKKPIASIQTIYADAAMPVVPPSRNLAQDQYLTALSALLPSGRFWPKHVTSNLMNVMALYTPALQRLADRGNYLLTDSFPATTGELLPEWEETLGLPDPCWGTDLTLDKRRAQVVARISQLGGQSVAAMNSYAASLGFTTTIKEYSSFKADLNAADGNLTDETYDNAWQMFAPSIGDWRFHADQNYADEALGGFGNDVLRCEINAVAPSHTNVNFVVARRNLLQQTELWGYPWVRSNVNVQKGMTDPLGGNSAYLITANSNATAIFGLTQALTGLTVGSRYTFSVYAKAYNNLDLYINTRVVDSTNSTNRYQMWGRLKTPVSFTTGGSATVTAETDTNQGLDGLWCRYVVSGVIASASTSIQINITNAPSGTTIGGSNGQGFYIWHPQFELGNLPGTTYVPSVDF